ncbi:MAG: phosphatase PAP2 family protein [Actinomycetota bacterium]
MRFVTQGDVATAHRNARRLLEFQQAIGLDFELGVQALFLDDHAIITMANWIYIWGYWPVLAFTLIYFGARHRDAYMELRNAMFISGAIGLVIFATYAVAPPRLFSSAYIDTVTEHSFFYRVAQPPSLANKYAAVPSFHFGWILLVAIGWYRVFRGSALRWLSMAMPIGMAFAVVVTANHWILDVLAGGLVSGAGLLLERYRQRLVLPFGANRWGQMMDNKPDELVLRLDAIEDRPREQRPNRT